MTHLPVQPPRLGITAPSNDSESGGSHSPSPRASRRRQVGVTRFQTKTRYFFPFAEDTQSLADVTVFIIAPPILFPVPGVPVHPEKAYRCV